MLFRELVEAFLRYNVQNRSPRTVDFYRDHLAKFLANHGALPAMELRPWHVLAFKPTWHLVLCVQRLYRWAVDEMELLPANPITRLRRPKPGCRKRTLSRAEVLRFLRISRSDLRRFLLAAWETAARPQELRCLRWEDLVWEGAFTELRGALLGGKAYFQLAEFKGRSRRSDPTSVRIIPVSPRLGRLLARLAVGRALSGVILVTDNGQPWNRNSLRCRMRRLRLLADVPLLAHGEKITCYTFRHSAATELAARGLQTSTLQQFLGHSNIKTTQRYVHLQKAQLLAHWLKFHGKKE